MNCAIYPRKSKANDNSQSMEQQIEDCRRYIQDHYPDATISIYNGDYALTGHSTKKRKDFLRMMDDVRSRKIQLVVIMRYDRIARNMRDFCNLYHDMEENGCNLVSVSQQIDTSTPYGKNFMYQMASMAELEWSLISERYKDMHHYKKTHGFVYTGKIPHYGFKIESTPAGKILVHDKEEETRDIFEYLLKCKSKNSTVEYVRKKYEAGFTRKMLESMINSDLYLGRIKENNSYCEPYFSEEYMQEVRSFNCIKQNPTGNKYLFTGLLNCPLCGKRLACNTITKRGKLYIYYRCPNALRRVHVHYAIAEELIENAIENDLEAYLEAFISKTTNPSSNLKTSVKTKIKSTEDAMKRLDHLYEMGRIDIDSYDLKIFECQKTIKELKKQINKKEIKAKNIICDDWKSMYMALDRDSKQVFIQNIIEEIVLTKEAEIASIIFK